MPTFLAQFLILRISKCQGILICINAQLECEVNLYLICTKKVLIDALFDTLEMILLNRGFGINFLNYDA